MELTIKTPCKLRYFDLMDILSTKEHFWVYVDRSYLEFIYFTLICTFHLTNLLPVGIGQICKLPVMIVIQICTKVKFDCQTCESEWEKHKDHMLLVWIVESLYRE